jgi:phosphatidate cytidylyltransferase
MTEPRPAAPGRFGDLGLRVLSAIALAVLVSVDLWLGGIWVSGLAALAAVLMLWELHRMATGNGARLAPGLVLPATAAALAVFVTGTAGVLWGLVPLLLGAALTLAAARPGARWMASGLVYIGFAMAYVPVLRDDPGLGLAAIVWLIVVVAAADIGAYFAGRSIGGPKLWPRVSPKKTWSGALGGLAAGVLLGLAAAAAFDWPPALVAVLSIGVVIASQAGDLLESSVKRHFGVKDASQLIPGHGGVMDRLDGIVGGLWFFAVYDSLGGSLGG